MIWVAGLVFQSAPNLRRSAASSDVYERQPSTSPSAAPSATPAVPGEAELAHTGSSATTAALAGGAGLLVTAGAATLYAVRRRANG
ncbi:hypothetical protein DRB89_40355 [Streptomyces sp. ICC4]|nr:hypothetical protein DRB89_40355 [Streptomyces sp. ICC4]